MDAEQLHFPDFVVPDFAQPPLQQADLAVPSGLQRAAALCNPDEESGMTRIAPSHLTGWWADMHCDAPTGIIIDISMLKRLLVTSIGRNIFI